MSEPEVCTRRPQSGDLVDRACPDCGHHLMLHVGCDECPVCRIEALIKAATKPRAGEWAQDASGEATMLRANSVIEVRDPSA